MPSPLLITGVSGFLGEHLARALAARGERVAGSYLTSPVAIPGVELFPFEMTDRLAWDRLVRDMAPRAIVHCAAQTQIGWCEDHPAAAREANVEAVEHLCAAVTKRAPQTPVIQISTDLVFDGEGAPYAEDAAPKPLSVYGSLKLAAERPVLSLPQGSVLRTALLYGAAATHKAGFLGWMRDTLQAGRTLTLFEDEWRTPVFVGDVIAAVQLLLGRAPERTAGKVFQAAGPDRLSRVEMGQAVCREFGFDPALIRVARRLDAPGGNLRPRDASMTVGRLAAEGWSSPTTFADGLRKCRTAP